jgi:multidrug transporter EmrE-like cation transporter
VIKLRSYNLEAFILLILAAFFSTVGNLILKISKTAELDFLPYWLVELRPLFFLAVVCYMLNLLIFSRVLQYLPVNISYPILASLGFIMLAVSSTFFLNEEMSYIQIMGLVVILVGIFMLAGVTPNRGL